MVEHVKDYDYSSWSEYNGQVEPVFRVCDTETVLRRIPFTDLDAIVNELLPDDAMYLENDEEKPKLRLSDDQVWLQIIQLTKVTSASAFQLLDKDQMRDVLRELFPIVYQFPQVPTQELLQWHTAGTHHQRVIRIEPLLKLAQPLVIGSTAALHLYSYQFTV